MLSSTTGKYLSSDTTMTPDAYYPDAVIDAFADGARKAMPQLFAEGAPVQPPGAGAVQKPPLTYAQSRKLILDALEAFDKDLGKRAREIFDAGFDAAVKQNFIEGRDETVTASDSRWRLRQVEPGKLGIMRCLPGGSPATPGKDPANPNPHAVIQFEYDGTITSAIYLAHELGHALADGYIRGKDGQKPGANPQPLDELQAYLVQHIIYDALRNSPDRSLAAGAQQQFAVTMAANLQLFPPALRELDARASVRNVPAVPNTTDPVARLHERPAGILTALGLFNLARAQTGEARRAIIETALGARGPKNVVEVLDAACIKDPAAMAKLARQTLQSAVSPLPAARPERGRGLTKAFRQVSLRPAVTAAVLAQQPSAQPSLPSPKPA